MDVSCLMIVFPAPIYNCVILADLLESYHLKKKLLFDTVYVELIMQDLPNLPTSQIAHRFLFRLGLTNYILIMSQLI